MAQTNILIVEDDFLEAQHMADAFDRCGAAVLGPAATLDQAIGLMAEADRVDAAVLDIRLGDNVVYPLAAVLRDYGVLFVFPSACGASEIHPRFHEVPFYSKPIDPAELARALFGVVEQR